MLELTPAAARAARCRAQLLTAKDRAADPPAAVRHMLALQAQNAKAGRWAVGIRTKGAAYSDVQAALESGALIRTWPMRGTHHIMGAEDVSWLTGLCAPRARSGVEKRRADLGLTLDDVLRAGTAVAEATTDPETLPEHIAAGAVAFIGPRGPAVALTRDGVRELWATVGIDSSSNRGSHMLRFLCEERILVQGPPVGVADTFTAFEAWVPGAGAAEGEGEADELLHRLVLRYLRGRGVAKASDLSWWTGHTRATTARAVEMAGDAVVRVNVAGESYLMLADAAEDAAARPASRPPRGPLLLPAFDEYLLGYGDRSLVMDTDVAAVVGPTKNGLFHRSVLAGGRILGTWGDDHPAAANYLAFAGA